MSMENGENPGMRVKDDEGKVDDKLKSRIIETRNRVRKTEEKLFVEVRTDPNVRISQQELVITWGMIVKQFLRSIEPLLRDEEVQGAQAYYTEKEIGKMVLVPSDEQGCEFSRIPQLKQQGKTDAEIRQVLGLPRGVELPYPEPKPFIGLKSIIEAPNMVEHQWVVKVEAAGAPPNHEHVYPTARRVVGKQIYEKGVRHADRFLQTAGIGLEIGEGDTPIIRGFDQSGDSNDAELDSTEYRGDPDI